MSDYDDYELNNNSGGGDGADVILGAILGSLVLVCTHVWAYFFGKDKGKVEGIKEGSEKVSREYDEKFKKLAADYAQRVKAFEEDYNEVKGQRDEAIKLLKDGCKLSDGFKSYASELKKEGLVPLKDTQKSYEQLQLSLESLKSYTKTA